MESELRADGLSPRAVMVLTATEDEESAVLKERYSCIMYRGYLLRWFSERLPNAKLFPRSAWYPCLWLEKTTPKEQMRNIQNAVRTLASILTETHKISSNNNEREPKTSLLPPAGLRQKWCYVQTEVQPGPFIVDSCPLMTPDHSRHLNSPSDHQSTSEGQEKRKHLAKVIVLSIYLAFYIHSGAKSFWYVKIH